MRTAPALLELKSDKSSFLHPQETGAMPEINIKYGRESYAVPFSLDYTIRQLVFSLEERLQVAFSTPKLLFKGKVLDSTSLVAEALPPSANVLLIASTSTTVEQIHENDTRFKTYRDNYNQAVRSAPKHVVESQEYYCATVQTLVLPDRERAFEILHLIRTNIAIRSIMKKYEWRISELIELHPNERTILGYNKNRTLIALRLRTDDLSGFRPFNSIMEVMLHELTHMVHSGHGDDFHRLNRQLIQESAVYHHNHILVKGSPSARSSNNQRVVSGSTNVLGGSVPSADVRTTLANAALLRLTESEKNMAKKCGSELKN